MAPPLRRKRLLINPKFQGLIALYSVITTLSLVPIFIAANVYFFNLFSAKAHSLGLPQGSELIQFVDRQQKLMVVVFLIATSVAIVINIVFSYVLSNRIAGSLYRLKTVMNQATDLADAESVQARKFDFFKDLYGAYNQLLVRLKS